MKSGKMTMTREDAIRAVLAYDTPSVTNVVATYGSDKEHCMGLYDPWMDKWYTDQSLHCIYPELGPRAGYAVTVIYGLPDGNCSGLGFFDVCKAIEASPKPVVLVIKQDMPERIKNRCGLCGGNMMTAFKALGTVGVISDGPCRDIDEVRPLGMQYMLTGVCAGHGDFGVHAVNTGVEVCGMEVMPGEIIHMDENGAVKFPADRLEDVCRLCERMRREESAKQKALSRCTTAEEAMEIVSATYR